MKVLASALLLLVLLGALVGSAYSQLPPSAKMRFPDRAVSWNVSLAHRTWAGAIVLGSSVVRVKMTAFAVSLLQVVSGLNQGGDNWQPMRIKAFYDQSIERCVYSVYNV